MLLNQNSRLCYNERNKKIGNFMTYADKIFKQNIQNILDNGVFSENARPKYKDGQTANSKYVTGSFVLMICKKVSFQLPLCVQFQLNQQLKN